MLKPYKQPPEILAVLINAMILGLDVLLLQKSDHLLLQLPAALARNDLDDGNTFLNRLINNVVQGLVNFPALVVDIVEVEYEFGHL